MFSKRQVLQAIVAGSIAFTSATVLANPQIRVVGSSTVYPFTTVVAEHFGRSGKYSTPVVESTGTGGGIKLFCAGVGEGMPDIANASRTIKESEKALCAHNKVTEITELKIGYDGIVLANSIDSKRFKLTKREIFLALARQVPKDGKLVKNDYQKWNQINASLPATAIEVYGPPPTSGTRDAFVELVMDEACEAMDAYKAAYPDEAERKKECQSIREDGKFIEVGENDNLIVQKLKANHGALGIFGYSFLEQNEDAIQGSIINGGEPTFENIASGTYSISRPLYIYIKNAHFTQTPGLEEFAQEYMSEKALGEDGYLIDKGLIPLKEDDLVLQRKKL